MNYTENYHLPQWDEGDRILRKDFNQMCADLEEGLTGNRETAAGANQAAAEQAESRAFDRVCRLAYNHYCFAQAAKPFPRQVGVFHQDTSVSMEGLENMSKYDGYAQMNYGSAPAAEDFFNSLEKPTPMDTSLPPYNLAMTIRFNAPTNGTIKTMTIHFIRKEDYPQAVTFPFTLTCKDLTTGKTTKEVNISAILPTNYTEWDIKFTAGVEFHQSHRYEIQIRADNAGLALVTGTLTDKDFSVDFTSTGPEASAVHVFREPEENLGFVAVVTCEMTGSTSEPKLLFDGEEIPCWWIRDVGNGSGKTIHEAVFRKNQPVKDGDRMALALSCQLGGDIILYSWGATLL